MLELTNDVNISVGKYFWHNYVRNASLMAQLVKNLPATRETWVWFLGLFPGLGRSPGERKDYSIQLFWPGKFHGLYSPWGGKESDTTEQPSLLLSMVSPTVWWAACPKPQLQRGAEPGFKVGWPETTSSVPATSPPSSKLILSREPLVLPLGSSDRATGPQSPVTYEQVTTELVEAKFLHVDMNAWKEWE